MRRKKHHDFLKIAGLKSAAFKTHKRKGCEKYADRTLYLQKCLSFVGADNKIREFAAMQTKELYNLFWNK